MSDNKVTLDQLDDSAVEAMSSSVGDVSMLNTENKTIVGAITEIVGKKEIANAIGEPLAETDKFTEMSSEINGLLSTFKTNMMNAGVVVESGDKFKQLIEKIKGLTEGEGNKGVQFASGTVSSPTGKKDFSRDNANGETEYVNASYGRITPGFKPQILLTYQEFKEIGYEEIQYIFTLYETMHDSHYNVFTRNIDTTYIVAGGSAAYHSSSVNNGEEFYDILMNDEEYYVNDIMYWYAIGVGEEDTTLRDSLASILTEEGVSVTEEDDMASLITKVDEEFTDKNNEIDYMIQGLTSALVDKGVKLDTDDDFESLLNIMNDMEYIPEIYYLIENGQINNELEWGYPDKGEQRDSSYYLPSSGEAQRLSLQDIVAIKTYEYLNLEINVINNSTSSYHQYLAIYDASNELVDYRYISGSTTIDREVLKIDISNIAKGFSFSLTSGVNVSVEVFNCYISKE